MYYLYLSVAIVCEVVGTISLRATEGFTQLIPCLLAAGGYAVSFYFLSLTLDKIPVAIAYSIWAGAGIVLVAVFGMIIFGQKPDLAAILGMIFIVIGVVAITGFSGMKVH